MEEKCANCGHGRYAHRLKTGGDPTISSRVCLMFEPSPAPVVLDAEVKSVVKHFLTLLVRDGAIGVDLMCYTQRFPGAKVGDKFKVTISREGE